MPIYISILMLIGCAKENDPANELTISGFSPPTAKINDTVIIKGAGLVP